MKKAFFILLAVLSLNSCVVGRYMCKYALLPEEHGNDFAGDREKTESRYPGIIAWYDGLHKAGVFRDTTLVGEGGYRLHAVYAPASDPAKAQVRPWWSTATPTTISASSTWSACTGTTSTTT